MYMYTYKHNIRKNRLADKGPDREITEHGDKVLSRRDTWMDR